MGHRLVVLLMQLYTVTRVTSIGHYIHISFFYSSSCVLSMSSRPKRRTRSARAPPAKRGRPALTDRVEVNPPEATAPSTSGLDASMTECIVAAVRTALQAATSTPDANQASQVANASVEEVVEADVSELVEGSDSAPVMEPSAPVFSSVTVPLGSRINTKLKAKIWANEYVDFGALLDPSPTPEKYSISFTTPQDSATSQPKLTLEPTTPPKKISSIDQWVSAFHTFVAVYCAKNPKEIANLMKYCETVRDIATRGGDWSYYDEQFRFLRQSDPNLYPWDNVHWELWHRAVTFRAKNNNFRVDKTQGRPKGKPPLPKGTCWSYNTGKHCSGCRYDHKCYKCGGKHAGSQCTVPASTARDKIPAKGNKQPAGDSR